MIDLTQLKNNLYNFLASYSNAMVLYDDNNIRIMDLEKPYSTIWCNDIRLYAKLVITGEVGSVKVTIVGKRPEKIVKTIIDTFRVFAVENGILSSVTMIDDPSATPASLENTKLSEALFFDFSKILKSNFDVKSPPDTIASSISDTNHSLFDVLINAKNKLAPFIDAHDNIHAENAQSFTNSKIQTQ